MSIHLLFVKIQSLSEQASIDSGTSYEEYLRLFTLYFERSFKRKSEVALKIAGVFGYDTSMRQRVTVQGSNRRCR
ncbi:hypothetical protein VH1709_contig00021-0009 [Vibrio harveyi]|uniref:Uncharacterized protein n=1 Tax=Vibrio harveyi TaxID=669 RepID=A0A8B3DMA4_VIBHA|nr:MULTISPECIES: hypothetical protein [Vibrio]EKO3838795.1 hypothetical protein [Vibrio harveyi]KNY43114.1 hypothetical protein AKG94_16490 [Vibrio harveyi]RCR62476.1 hypothetical protein DTW68_15395 [Vibrio harveyi]RIW13489.1 hypothetical protein DS957_011030 [Vibrio harveyi]CAH1547275.1 conserved protein of unknown function [Vibrio harveyi]